MKLDYRKTCLIGLGFFTISIAWPMYNNYVPILLSKYIQSGLWIGLIMSFDNIFAAVFQPFFGSMSDRTESKFGKRMPFLLIGIPVAAVSFALIPFGNNLITLMLFIIIMNFSMSIYRAPAVALMPDLTHPSLRSKANGVINFMGGIAAVIAYGVGGVLYGYNQNFPFYMGAIIMITALVVLYSTIKEPITAYNHEKEDQKQEVQNNTKEVKTSLIFILIAIFFWFCSFNALETFFSLYGQEVLNINPGNTSILLFLFSGSFMVFSIPAGFVGSRIGRKTSILIGILGLLMIFVVFIIIKVVWIMKILLVFGGMFWSLININSYPMVVEMASKSNVGKYTGYYYFFSACASIISPVLFGSIKDLIGSYQHLFIYSTLTLLVALICLLPVKHGESDLNKMDTLDAIDKM